jgi:hypothetical protein
VFFSDITNENFSIGQFWFESYSTLKLQVVNGTGTYEGTISHHIDNRFQDAADTENVTPDQMDELPGGTAFDISGLWTENVRGSI